MAIYTKRGDQGKTSLFGQKKEIRVSKTSAKIAAIGTIDELNSFLGIVGDLSFVQKDLFTINSILAGAKLRFSSSKTKKLEKAIDKLEGSLPVLKNFIIYGGGKRGSLLFFARALCRRAERNLIALSKLQATSYELLSYMNRLSDFLFMLARDSNYKERIKEKVWRASRK